jgi:hypothetical protein
VPDPSAARLNRIPTSIDTLSPKNRFVVEIEKYPTVPGIPYHTIEGDRGRGDAPNSSDGVVPYWSSHFGGETSELIVPSDHSAPRNPQAIAEVRRILRLHANISKSSRQSSSIAGGEQDSFPSGEEPAAPATQFKVVTKGMNDEPLLATGKEFSGADTP